MSYLFFTPLAIIFIGINYLILKNDILHKKIPNKLLAYLLVIIPLWYTYGYIFGYFDTSSALSFITQIIITFIIGFLLFYFKIWGAGDAKYLLVLGLFIPHIGFFILLGNIGIFTILYLIFYMLWFWIGPNLLIKSKRKTIYGSLLVEIKQKIQSQKANILDSSKATILTGIVYFLAIFVFIRLIRTYLIIWIQNEFIITIIQDYNFIILGICALIFIIIQKAIKNLFYNISSKKFKTHDSQTKVYSLYIILFFLLAFIYFEYQNNPDEIQTQLHKILTYCVIIFISFRVLIYSYKFYFKKTHLLAKPLDEIIAGDMIDYSHFIKKYGEETSIGYLPKDQRKTMKNTRILAPDPKIFFRKLRGGIRKKDIKKFKKVCEILEIKHIYIQEIFAFGVFIFGGFVITFLFQEKIIHFIISFATYIIKSL